MNLFSFLAYFPDALLVFLLSLILVITTAAQFTRRLEMLCEELGLSIGMLSLFSSLGANIPNYAASAAAIVSGHSDTGLGIIIGSNIYNIAIILGLCMLLSPQHGGIRLSIPARRDVFVIACYNGFIACFVLAVVATLPGASLFMGTHKQISLSLLHMGISGGTFVIFGALLVHILRRSHGNAETAVHSYELLPRKSPLVLLRLGAEVLFFLAIALVGVLFMVQAGQALTTDIHLPSTLAGLLVLAVATSLPNTVVAVGLVRTGEAAACLEEISSSNSVNGVLGIVLPLIFWQSSVRDHLLLLLDSPLLLVLTLLVLFAVWRGHMSRRLGIVLLCVYIGWVVVRFVV